MLDDLFVPTPPTGATTKQIANCEFVASAISTALATALVQTLSTWTPVWGGFSGAPTGGTANYVKTGKMVLAYVNSFAAGTSNSTTKTITLPFTAARAIVMAGVGHPMDNSAFSTTLCRFDTRANSTTCDVYKDPNANAWTASGQCVFDFTLTYESAS